MGLRWRNLFADRGATAVEYALIASLIAAVIAAVVMVLGQHVVEMLDSVTWW